MTQPWIESPSSNHGGSRSWTDGVIVHSTRGDGGDREFEATLNWFNNPDSQASAHVVIARDGRKARCVDSSLIAWHAGEHNAYYLGVELEQATREEEYTDHQYYILSTWILSQAQVFGFPISRTNIVGHEETAQGKRMVKSDPGYKFDWDKLMGLLLS